MWIRLATVWIGSALAGSSLGTLVQQILYHGAWSGSDMRSFVGFALITLFWTVPGSALLFLIFGVLRGRDLSLGWSLFLLVILGTIAGGLMLSLFGMRASNFAVGALYGLATAISWAALSSVVGAFRLDGRAA
jgi:hypothetical protein